MTDCHTELCAAVGSALAAWSGVEVSLTTLFATIADLQDTRDIQINRKAHLIFDTIVSFETRLDIVDALMAEEGLPPLDLETWNRCSIRLAKLYKRRHGLAHFSLIATSEVATDPTRLAEVSFRLSPFFTMADAFRGELQYLTKAQIDERSLHFGQMVLAIMRFAWEAKKRRGLQPGYPMPDSPLYARFQASASQILEERANKPQPSGPLSEMDADL